LYFVFQHGAAQYKADLEQGTDLSIPLLAGLDTINCFWAPPVTYEPVVSGDFIGSTEVGGPVNFFNVRFNPHGNGTHTECVGHIAAARYRLRECLRESHFAACLISLFPQKMENGDRVILREQIAECMPTDAIPPGLIIRTLPNDDLKRRTQYSGANPPYLHAEAAQYIADCGVRHLLLDLPSVDREVDGGQLLAHKAFWRYPGDAVRADCTITELIYVPNELKDGLYLLNLQTAAFDIDASPSRPVAFSVTSYI
jgi:arylformamidase